MAVKSKVQLAADIAASTFTAPQQVILDDMVDSYQDLSQGLTTVQIAAIASPSSGQLVYNTDLSQFQYYNGVAWVGLANGLGVPQTVQVNLTSAQILDAYNTQILLIAAPGAGLAVVAESIIGVFTCGNTPYATNTDFLIKHQTAGFADYQIKIPNGIGSAAAFLNKVFFIAPAFNVDLENTVVRTNEGLYFCIDDGNPTAGDGILTVHVTYKTIAY